MTPPAAIVPAYRLLLLAVLEQAAQDARRGNPGARAWLCTPGFAYICDWLELDPAVTRRAILAGARPVHYGGRARQYSDEQLAEAVALHQQGYFWRDIAAQFGVSRYGLQCAVSRWQLERQAQAAGD